MYRQLCSLPQVSFSISLCQYSFKALLLQPRLEDLNEEEENSRYEMRFGSARHLLPLTLRNSVLNSSTRMMFSSLSVSSSLVKRKHLPFGGSIDQRRNIPWR